MIPLFSSRASNKNYCKTHCKRKKGFTLLELMISIGILSIMGLITAQTLKNTTKRNKKITSGIDKINTLRSAFRLIERDLGAAFNYRDINIFLYNQAQKERISRYEQKKKDYVEKKNKDGAQPPLNLASLNDAQVKDMEKEIGPQPVEKPLREDFVVTHFKGEKDELYFTSSSGSRLRESDNISDLVEVGYLVKNCRSRRSRKISSKCLWRSISHNLDGDVKEGGKPSVLLENIEEIKFTYLTFNQEDPEWIESWDSENVSDIVTGNKFPAAVYVEATLSIPIDKKGEKKKKEFLAGTFPIRFPNNEPFKNLPRVSSGTNNNGSGSSDEVVPPPDDGEDAI